MKKKILTALFAGIFGSAVIVSGSVCTFAAGTEVAEKSAEDTAELKTIGAKEKEEGAFSVKLKNATGKDIKEIKIKVSGHSEFADTENLLEKDAVFAAEEERILNYLPKVKEETEEKKEDSKEKEEPLVFDIQLTFADDTTAVVHTFPFGDIEEGEICMDGELAYLVFESVNLKKEVNTLETETTIAEMIKAQKEAAAQAAASSSGSESYDYSYDYDYDYSGDYDYGDGDDGGSDAGSGDGGTTDGGDGCLNGGLLN